MSEESSTNHPESQQPAERRKRVRRRRRTHQPMADAGNEGSPSSGLPWLGGILLIWVVLSVTTVLLMKRCVPVEDEDEGASPTEVMSRGDIERVRNVHKQAIRQE